MLFVSFVFSFILLLLSVFFPFSFLLLLHLLSSRDYYIAKLNRRSNNATPTFENRLKTWKEKVQLQHNFHTDSQSLLPDTGSPLPHFTRMLPINVDCGGGRRGVFALAVHLPDSVNDAGQARALDAFKYCRTMVTMYLETGEVRKPFFIYRPTFVCFFLFVF